MLYNINRYCLPRIPNYLRLRTDLFTVTIALSVQMRCHCPIFCNIYAEICAHAHRNSIVSFVSNGFVTIIIALLCDTDSACRIIEQESRAIARKPCEDATVRCALKFADIHYKLNSSQAPKARLHSYRHTGAK